MAEQRYPYRLQLRKVITGFFRMMPIAFFVASFGVAFGLSAVQKGIDPLLVALMSITVFAGASQFGVLELWGDEVPFLALVSVVFAINSRHLLMGASLYPMLKDLSPGKRYGILLLLTDPPWAASVQDYQNGWRNLEVILGGGLVLWLLWSVGSILGAYFGNLLSDPESFGLDMALGCFLLSMALGGRKTPGILLAWSITAVVALVAYYYLPPHTHVVAGSLAGGLVGLFQKNPAAD